MELPNIPTDNIYKFSTVLGVILIVFSLTTWFNRLDQRFENIKKRSEENVLKIIEQSYIENDIKTLSKRLDSFSTNKVIKNKYISYSKGSNLYSPKLFEVNDSIFLYKYKIKKIFSNDSLLINLIDSLNYKIKVSEENRWKLINYKRFDKYDSYNNKFVQFFLTMSIILGFSLTIWGFISWRKKDAKPKKKKAK